MPDGDHGGRVPTEPGDHYLRVPDHCAGAWKVVHITDWGLPVPLEVLWHGDDDTWPLAEVAATPGCEWGPRIPSPERLAAMEELTLCYPWYTGPEGDKWCLPCGYPRPTHAPDCPWQRAQEPENA